MNYQKYKIIRAYILGEVNKYQSCFKTLEEKVKFQEKDREAEGD